MFEMFDIPEGWVKFFSDGTSETGWDDDPKATWSRGRLDHMTAVMLCSNRVTVMLSADPGDTAKFWQSDDYEVEFGKQDPVRITRRIQQKIGDKCWKTLEINVKTGEITEYFSKHKI